MPITATVKRPEHRAEHRAAAAEQARSAQHDRGDDLEFEAPAGVRGPASQAASDDDSRHRRGESAQRVDRKRDLLGVDARAPDRFCVRADAGHIATEGGFIEDKEAQRQHDDGDDRGHRQAEDPAAPDRVERALRIDRDRIAFRQKQRRASDGAQARKRDDEGGNALIGDEEALEDADDDPHAKHQHDHQRPRDARLQRNRRQRVHERQHRADRQIDPRGRDHEGHRDRHDHKGRDLSQDVEEIGLGEERVGDQRERDRHHDEERLRC